MADSVYTLNDRNSAIDRWKATGAFLLNNHKSLSGFHLNVTAGAHSGIATAFDGKPYTIGSGGENNLILFADDLKEIHARLTPAGKLGNQLRIDAVDGPIAVGDRGTLRRGEWTIIKEKTSLMMGGATIDIAPIMDPAKLTRGAAMIGSIAILAFLVTYVVATSWSDSSRSINALLSPTVSVQQPITPATPISDAQIAAAKGLSQIRLGELGIAHLVKLANIDGGSLIVEGLMPDSLRGKWNSFLQWYDTQANYPALVNNVTMTGAEQDVPSVASVWMGKNPMVEFSDGTKGSIGSQVKGGWSISGIFTDRVDLSKNGVTIAIQFGGAPQ